MLVTMFLWHEKLLGMPILYLSDYFKRHQKLYYEKISNYHDGEVAEWIDFFLDGVIDIADSAILTCEKITKLREKDMMKIQQMNKAASETSMKMLVNLYKMPIVGVADIAKWTGHSGTPDRSRTYDTQLRKLVLYPLSYGRIQGHYSVKVGKCKGREC